MERSRRIDFNSINDHITQFPQLREIILRMVEAYIFGAEDLDGTILQTLEHYKILK